MFALADAQQPGYLVPVEASDHFTADDDHGNAAQTAGHLHQLLEVIGVVNHILGIELDAF